MCSPPLIMGLLSIMYSCEEALKPINTIKFYLHRIDRDRKNVDLHRIIVNFSTQILSERIHFDVNGFFDINFDLLKSVNRYFPLYYIIFKFVVFYLFRYLVLLPFTWLFSFSLCPQIKINKLFIKIIP